MIAFKEFRIQNSESSSQMSEVGVRRDGEMDSVNGEVTRQQRKFGRLLVLKVGGSKRFVAMMRFFEGVVRNRKDRSLSR